MRQIVIDATKDQVILENGYAMFINGNRYEGSFYTDIPDGCVALARIYEVDTETGSVGENSLDEFIIVGKGESDPRR